MEELEKFIKGVPPAAARVCEICDEMRFVLCQTCNGIQKYYWEKSGFRTCNTYNENGLIRCPDYCSKIDVQFMD